MLYEGSVPASTPAFTFTDPAVTFTSRIHTRIHILVSHLYIRNRTQHLAYAARPLLTHFAFTYTYPASTAALTRMNLHLTSFALNHIAHIARHIAHIHTDIHAHISHIRTRIRIIISRIHTLIHDYVFHHPHLSAPFSKPA